MNLVFQFLWTLQIKEQLNVFLEGWYRQISAIGKFKYIPSVRDRVGNVSALGRRLNQMTSEVQLLDFII